MAAFFSSGLPEMKLPVVIPSRLGDSRSLQRNRGYRQDGKWSVPTDKRSFSRF